MDRTQALTARDVEIPAGAVVLPGTLTTAPHAPGVVLFAHGSGSSRHSPRNKLVAEALQTAGIGTLLFDLLTEAEARDRRNVFAIELLAERLDQARRWLEGAMVSDHPALGYFGASTGAAAALVAEADNPHSVAAIVSRGGRPDLAGEALGRVTAPTLLIVGGADYDVLELNQEALARLRSTKKLVVVPGATHLFEETGTLEQAARLASDWFTAHLRQPTKS
ncbi:MAG TPA: alpha/beta family hydrolase [Gemmatimonadales bacterium]|nr:alpha/beta family hydrolase [Gemmatimonadales bacterium]